MNPEEPLCLVNPFRRFVRNFLIMAALFFAVGAAAILICALPVARSFGPNSGATTAIILTLALCVPLTVAMLVSVLFTLPSVRRAERAFAEYRNGHYLARWNCSPEEWRAYVEEVARGMIKMNWWFAAAILGLTCIPGIAATWNADNTLPAKIGLTLLMPGGTLIIGGTIYGIIRLAGRRRRNRLLAAAPQVFIGSDAVYCGGEFGFWGSGMRALKSVTLLQGPPKTLEFNIGLTRAGEAAFAAVGTTGFAVRHPLPFSSFNNRQLVPIPAGAEAEAEQIAQHFANLPQ